jgi:hypothetical protein
MILKATSIACPFVCPATISEALQYTPVFDVVSKNFRVNPAFLRPPSVLLGAALLCWPQPLKKRRSNQRSLAVYDSFFGAVKVSSKFL